MTDSAILVAVGCGAILYFVLCNRAVQLVHPLRMEMVELGGKLIANPKINDHLAEMIEHSLSRAYSTISAWLYVILLPVAVVLTLIDQARGRKSSLETLPRELAVDYARITRLSTISALANSPLAALIFVIEFMIAAVLFFPVGNAMEQLMSIAQNSRDSLSIGHHKRA